MTLSRKICRFLYYNFAQYLPVSYSPYVLCKNIFEYCGNNVNIEKRASFGGGEHIRIGDNSGLGLRCVIPDGTVIGNDVMMGPDCLVYSRNHAFDRIDIPMRLQGYSEEKPLVIDDDVWIGGGVTIMVGRHISKGSIIAARCVLTKDFPEYSIVGGNPSRLLRSRK